MFQWTTGNSRAAIIPLWRLSGQFGRRTMPLLLRMRTPRDIFEGGVPVAAVERVA